MKTPVISAHYDRSSSRTQLDKGSSYFLRIASAVDGEDMHCVICGREVDPDSFCADRYNQVACSHHRLRACRFCKRIIVGDGVEVPHFGTVCGKCGVERDYKELEAVRGFVYDFFREHRLYLPSFRLRLVSAEEMHAQYADCFGATPRGVAVSDGGDGYVVNIMRQMSRIGLAQTLTHELTHLWQWHRNIEAPETYCEGFCNLIAFLVISRINKGEALVHLSEMMENPDPAYGAAFRELKIVYDVYGWDTVVAAMKKFTNHSKGLPEG